MKSRILQIVLLIAAFFVSGRVSASATEPTASPTSGVPAGTGRASVADTTVFYQPLTPYGHWFSFENYGWCWTPYNVAVDWRPYTDGYWAYTDYGWTWMSNDPWGWATYHYGRWTFDAGYGWVWVPGTEWAPAWVGWRGGNGWIGWCPLSPVVGFDSVSGLEFGALDFDAVIPTFWWSFVPEPFFIERDLRSRIVIPARNVTLLKSTARLNDYALAGGVLANRNVDVERIERLTGRAVPRFEITDVISARELARGGHFEGNRVAMFRPEIHGLAARGPVNLPRDTNRGLPNAASRPASPSPEILQRQEHERQDLEQRQAQARTELERHHQEEMNQPSGTPPEEMMRRHEDERRAFEEQRQRERQFLDNRHEMERRGDFRSGAPPATARRH